MRLLLRRYAGRQLLRRGALQQVLETQEHPIVVARQRLQPCDELTHLPAHLHDKAALVLGSSQQEARRVLPEGLLPAALAVLDNRLDWLLLPHIVDAQAWVAPRCDGDPLCQLVRILMRDKLERTAL